MIKTLIEKSRPLVFLFDVVDNKTEYGDGSDTHTQDFCTGLDMSCLHGNVSPW